MRLWMFLALLLLTGCGYQSTAHFAKNVVGDRVSTEVVVAMEDPENTVLIKDAVDMAVITKFRTALVPKSEAQTHLKISIGSVTFTPLRYDINGYVITYRTIVVMRVARTQGEKTTMYETHGFYDFAIEPNAIITDKARFDAIRQSAQKAIDAFVAQIAAQGTITDKGL